MSTLFFNKDYLTESAAVVQSGGGAWRRGKNAQRGIALIVALMILVLVTLAAAAMMRSLDSNLLAVGNLSFRQAAEAPIAQAVETAMTAIEDEDKTWLESYSAGNNYYAFVQANEDVDGIPRALQNPIDGVFGNYPSGFRSLLDANGNTVRYVVERMCREGGKWSEENCVKAVSFIDLSKVGTSSNIPLTSEFVESEPGAYYRITVRVDGPAGTRVFAQAVVVSGVGLSGAGA
jgi:hypothetical protein